MYNYIHINEGITALQVYPTENYLATIVQFKRVWGEAKGITHKVHYSLTCIWKYTGMHVCWVFASIYNVPCFINITI